jgi:ribosomal protein S18 acetylase RimI-like enzyme
MRTSEERGSGVRIRPMWDMDLERILELREIVRWSADPNAFGLLRGMSDARWAIAEAPGGKLIGMVGAVPLGEIGILCHLATHHDYRKAGLGATLSSWAVSYLLSRGCRTVRLDSTRQAEKLYRSLGFMPVAHRTSYRLEGDSREDAIRDAWLREAGSPDEVKVAPLLFGDLPELYGVDRWSFGGDRSALILATLRRHPGWGLVARDASGMIKGYLVRSVSETGTRIGPFMASEPEIARALLSRALDVNGGNASVEVSVPNSGQAHALLEEFQFTGRVDRLRMELGEAPGAQGLQIYGTTPYLAT